MAKKKQTTKKTTKKAASKASGRQALGRGLGALMRSTLVDVNVSEQLESKPAKAIAGQPIADIIPDYEPEVPPAH